MHSIVNLFLIIYYLIALFVYLKSCFWVSYNPFFSLLVYWFSSGTFTWGSKLPVTKMLYEIKMSSPLNHECISEYVLFNYTNELTSSSMFGSKIIFIFFSCLSYPNTTHKFHVRYKLINKKDGPKPGINSQIWPIWIQILRWCVIVKWSTDAFLQRVESLRIYSFLRLIRTNYHLSNKFI